MRWSLLMLMGFLACAQTRQETARSTPPPAREPAARTDCREGSEWDGQRCAAVHCPESTHLEAGECVAASVPEEPPEPPVEPELPIEPEAQPDQPIQPVPTQPVSPSSRDPRKLATAPRPQTLLITEIQALERLYAVTAKPSPDRVLLLRRLAEAYVELEYSASAGTDAKSVKLLVAARKKAIDHYRRVMKEYPGYAKLDEVVYYLGYEYERAGDSANARAMYRKLTNEFPKSSYLLRLPKKR